MPNTLSSHRVKVGDSDIHYLTGGTGEPLLIIHGGGDGANAWAQTAARLARHYTVIVPDLPGYGESDAISEDFHVGEYVSFIADFLHCVGLKKLHVVGHSLGGSLALHFALRFPERVGKLVLVSSLALGKEFNFWIKLLCRPAAIAGFLRGWKVLWKGVRKCAGVFVNPARLLDPVPALMFSIGKTLTDMSGQTTVLGHRLSELKMPTLIVWGARDPLVPVCHAYVAAELIPDCRVRVFDDCGHSVYREKLGEFSQAVTDFFRES